MRTDGHDRSDKAIEPDPEYMYTLDMVGRYASYCLEHTFQGVKTKEKAI